MEILSINDFTTKLLSKHLSDLYTGVHLKGTLVVKLLIDNFFIERLFFMCPFFYETDITYGKPVLWCL